jgi:hypothetical protein
MESKQLRRRLSLSNQIPFSRRICRHPQPHDPTSMVPQDQGSHTAAGRVSARRIGPSTRCRRMIAKKGPPPCDGPPLLRHVLCDARLAHVDAELEQFAVDAGAPRAGWPGSRINLRISRGRLVSAAPSGFPAPERSKSGPVPTNHGSGRTMASASRYRERGDTAQRTPIGRRSGKQISGNCAAALIAAGEPGFRSAALSSAISWSVQSTV